MNTNCTNIIVKSKSLQLLKEYESESDEDDNLIQKTTQKRQLNKSNISENISTKKTKLEKLPVPAFFIENEKVEEYEDDPSLHGGRVRTFAHERGNWATYIYLPYDGNENMVKLIEGIANLCLPITKLEIVNDFHISLTKTVILKHHWIESFISSVRKKIISNSVKKFQVFFNNVEIYTNEEKTRTFLGLNIYAGFDHLNDAVQIFNECLKEFKLNSFYEDPSFHMSVLWCIGNKKHELNSILQEINNFVSNYMERCTDTDWNLNAKYFICKSGNKQFSFHLS